ncbi:hypothetical protein J6590_008706 [Homalodisca vitripennis]|nr:hypothetical protein J6590_008706 [Homalodisca vitripennis]
MIVSWKLTSRLDGAVRCGPARGERRAGIECRNHTLDVYLDLSKAFDYIDLGTLLDKLESHGIRGVPLKWLD